MPRPREAFRFPATAVKSSPWVPSMQPVGDWRTVRAAPSTVRPNRTWWRRCRFPVVGVRVPSPALPPPLRKPARSPPCSGRVTPTGTRSKSARRFRVQLTPVRRTVPLGKPDTVCCVYRLRIRYGCSVLAPPVPTACATKCNCCKDLRYYDANPFLIRTCVVATPRIVDFRKRPGGR